MQSAASSVAQYLADLPESRRAVISAVRAMVHRHMPSGYRESMAFGMIGWGIPLERYPDTYNKQPLGYVALAAQKQYNTLYLMGVYADSAQERALREGYAARGLKLDFGKSCLRFRDDAPPPEDVVGPIIASLGVDDLIAVYEAARSAPRARLATKSADKATARATGKPVAKPATKRAAKPAAKSASGPGRKPTRSPR